MSGRVTLRYWAAARAAAGVEADVIDGAATLAELIVEAGSRHPGRLSDVLAICSYLIDEQPAGTRDRSQVLLHDGAVVEALPPFAGG